MRFARHRAERHRGTDRAQSRSRLVVDDVHVVQCLPTEDDIDLLADLPNGYFAGDWDAIRELRGGAPDAGSGTGTSSSGSARPHWGS